MGATLVEENQVVAISVLDVRSVLAGETRYITTLAFGTSEAVSPG